MPQTIEDFVGQNPSPPDNPKSIPIEDWNSLRPDDSGFEGSVFKTDPDLVNTWAERGKIGFFEGLAREDKTQAIPFYPGGAIKMFGVLNSTRRLAKGEYADPANRERDELKVGNFLMALEEERVRGYSIPGRIAQGAVHLPAFMGEFMATGGLATLTKFTVKRGISGLAKKAIEKNVAVRLAGQLSATGARTALMPHRVAEGYADRQTQAHLKLTDQGVQLLKEGTEKPITSALKSVGDVFIENLSEDSGALLGGVTKKVVSKIIPEGLTKSIEKVFSRLHPNEAVSKLWTKAGYHGFLQEMGEERVGDLMRAVTGVEDFGAENPHNVMDRVIASIPNWEELLIEAGTLSIPGLGKAGVSQSLNALGKLKKALTKDTTKEIDDETADRLAAQVTDKGESEGIKLDYPEELSKEDAAYAESRIEELQAEVQTPEVAKEIEELRELIEGEQYAPEEGEVEKMVDESFKGVAKKKDAFFVLGPTASGKTSLATSFSQGGGSPIIDPDRYKEKYKGYSAERAYKYHEASSVANRQAMKKAIAEDYPFVNVVTGRNTEKYSKIVDELNSKEVPVMARYIYVDLEESQRRNEQRRKHKGGMNIPSWAVRENHKGGLKTLFEVFIPKSKDTIIYGNPFNAEGKSAPTSIAHFKEGKLVELKNKETFVKMLKEWYTLKGKEISDGEANDIIRSGEIVPVRELDGIDGSGGRLNEGRKEDQGQSIPGETKEGQEVNDQLDLFSQEREIAYGKKDAKSPVLKLEKTQSDITVNTPGGRSPIWDSPFALKFKKNGALSFPNQKITGPADVAFAFQFLRNEVQENCYVVAVKEGQVVGTELLHVGTMSSSVASTLDMVPIMQTYEADSFYLVHHHPSGVVKASDPDRKFTTRAINAFKNLNIKYLGHIIINGDKFGFLDGALHFKEIPHEEYKDTKDVAVLKKYGEWKAAKNSRVAIDIKDPKNTFEIIKGIELQDDKVVLIIGDHQLQVQNVVVLPRESVNADTIVRLASAARGDYVIFANAKFNSHSLRDLARQLILFEIRVWDSVEARGESFHSMRASGMLGEEEVGQLGEPERYRSELLKFIKKRGGLNYEGMKGEVKMFLGKDSGYVGLVSKKGISVDRMAEAIREAISSGELEYHGPMETEADLVEAVRDELYKIKNLNVEDEEDLEGAMMARLEALPKEERDAEEGTAKRIRKVDDDRSIDAFEKSFKNFPKKATQKELIEFYKGLTPKERTRARIENMKRNRDLKSGPSMSKHFYKAVAKKPHSRFKGDVARTTQDFLAFTEKVGGAISTRARNISTKIEAALRKFEFGLKMANISDLKKANEFLKKFHQMKKANPQEYRRLDFALKNRDATEIKNILEKNALSADYATVMELLDDIYIRATDAGLDVGYLKDYFPRSVRDKLGLLKHFQGLAEWSHIAEFIREKERQIGRRLTEDEKGAAIGEFLLRMRSGDLMIPGNVKERLITVITPELDQYYGDSLDSLVGYIGAMNEAIQTRVFFGKYANQFESMDQVDNVIGSYVLGLIQDKTISPLQEQELSAILKARFNQKGTHGFWTLAKNLSYIETMGSYISAITQIGDIAWSLYKNGFYRTSKALSQAITRTGLVKREDVGVTSMSEEFTEGGNLSKAVTWIFKNVGIDAIDMIGKETFLNASLAKLTEAAQSPSVELVNEINTIFGAESSQVLQDLKDKKYSENVRMLLFSELSNFQPISLSEMPELYLTSGNGRVFYMLKSYTLKQIDVFRREAFDKMGKPETRVEGFKNMVKLAAALMLMNAGADVIKALILGRPIDPQDLFWDNLVRLLGFTKYNIYKFKEEGIVGGLAKVILPPLFSSSTDLLDDIWDMFSDDPAPLGKQKSIQRIPFLGKIYYWRAGEGADKSEKKRSGGRRRAGI